MRGLRVVAVVVSLLFGLIGGLAAAKWTQDDHQPAARDPLHLGIPMVDQACTGRSLLLLGRGSTRAALRTSIVNAAGGDRAHYLDVHRSCPTVYTTAEVGSPEYAVYLGPYGNATAACEVRMTAEHAGDAVTRLADGNEIYVKCPCELSTSTMPTLRPGMTPTVLDTMWVKQLQGMLVDIHRLRDDVDETGTYDRRTAARMRKIQAFYGQPTTGIVDPTTWGLLIGRACQHYDY